MPLTPFDEAVSSGFQYSLLNEQYQALHPPVQCKDFITDAFGSEILKEPFSLYRFTWKPGTMNVTADWFLIALSIKKSGFSSKQAMAVNGFVNSISEGMGIVPISTELCDDIIVVDFHKAWIAQPILLSALMLFLRIGVSYQHEGAMSFLNTIALGNVDTITPHDSNIVKVALPKLTRLSQGLKLVQTWGQYTHEPYLLHHSSGILYYNKLSNE